VTPAPRVLLVEDDAATREGYRQYLTGCGMAVTAVANGYEALMHAGSAAPQVIVLDLGLPDIDGWEVARRLKSAPGTAAIRIIALTGSDLPHERVSAMRAGCDRHLAKPCAPGDLLAAIRRCVGEST
jgi:CheY-like chemotaxis protein